jgi:hypothetical protein
VSGITFNILNKCNLKIIYLEPPHELQPDFAYRTRLIIPILFKPPESLVARGIGARGAFKDGLYGCDCIEGW